jgi:DNA-binding transcriptional MocR family regulator
MVTPLKEKIEILEQKNHPFFRKDHKVDLSFDHLVPRHRFEFTELLLRTSYVKCCFEKEVIDLSDRHTMDSINEVSSGNNDLGYFNCLVELTNKVHEKTNYHLSNYSGGRGDYFTVQQLVHIENEVYKFITQKSDKYNINSIALTFGGQGAYSIIARYLKNNFADKKVLFLDSTYASNYRPFSRIGLNLLFASSNSHSMIPEVDELIHYIRKNDISAFFLVHFHNPSGENFSYEELKRIITALKEKDAYLIFSEAYQSLYFNGNYLNQFNILKICEELEFNKIIRVKTLSKECGLAGLRAAYMIAPDEIIQATININDEFAYNPSLYNNPTLVSNSYFQYKFLTNQAIISVEKWLEIDEINDYYNQYSSAHKKQLKEIKTNLKKVICYLFPEKDSSEYNFNDSRHITNDNFEVIIPQGGINLAIKINFLEPFDHIDVFRKIFLETGTILHPSHFINNKDGFWIRLTLSHTYKKIQQTVALLKDLKDQISYYSFLPKDSIECFSYHSTLSPPETNIRLKLLQNL